MSVSKKNDIERESKVIKLDAKSAIKLQFMKEYNMPADFGDIKQTRKVTGR